MLVRPNPVAGAEGPETSAKESIERSATHTSPIRQPDCAAWCAARREAAKVARTLAIEAEAMDSPSPRKGNGATRAQQAEAGLSALAGELVLLPVVCPKGKRSQSKTRAYVQVSSRR